MLHIVHSTDVVDRGVQISSPAAATDFRVFLPTFFLALYIQSDQLIITDWALI